MLRLNPDELFAEFLVEGLLRGDTITRYQAYEIGLRNGWLTVGEVRRRENLNPLPANTPAAIAATPTPAAGRSVEARAMTISIDFDETFSKDPVMWGEFAMKSESEGNTIVMISRRPDTVANQKEIADTIGIHLHAFSKIMLIGEGMQKADAAAAAGISVDVWIDDAPETIQSSTEDRAAPDALEVGDFVSWGSGDGRARGRITRIVRDGTINVPDSSFTIQGTEGDPAALIRVYREGADGWNATDVLVGHKFSTLTKIAPLSQREVSDGV